MPPCGADFAIAAFLVFSCAHTDSTQDVKKAPENNYCYNQEFWAEWSALIAKYPGDDEIHLLHALRIGLCTKIERGSITLDRAIIIFEKAHDAVIRRREEEQKKQQEKPTL